MRVGTEMQVTVNTDTDTFDDALRAVHAAYGRSYSNGSPDTEGTSATVPTGNGNGVDPILPGGWNAKRLKKWTEWLQPNAQEVVRYVAAHAPVVKYDDVAAHLGEVLGYGEPVDGKVLGGAMSSGGHALRKVGQSMKAQPIDRDHARRAYVVDERIAEILTELLGDPQDV